MANGHAWTPDELATLRRMAGAGYTDGEIARHIDRHPKCVGDKRRELRIESGLSPSLKAMLARWNARRILKAA